MREILFRGKRVDNGGWVEGYYAVKGKGTDLEKHFIVTSTFCSNTNAYPFYFTDNWVEPETICQYTGLKDKFGKKVFEGDILNVIYSDQQGECHYAENYLLDDLRTTSVIGWLDYANELEIVGNKFDNPELI